jgi:polyisoprenoid-binding protein YceI
MAMRTDRTDERRDLHLPTPGNWVIDPVHSEIHFIVRHMMISTVRGRFREFSGEAVDPWGNTRAGFAGTMEIDREDFGLTWNQALEAGGVILGREIRFELDVEAVRQSDGDS